MFRPGADIVCPAAAAVGLRPEEGERVIESGNPNRIERRVEAMMASLHAAFDDQPPDAAVHDAIGAAIGIDPDDPPMVPEDWVASELAVVR